VLSAAVSLQVLDSSSHIVLSQVNIKSASIRAEVEGMQHVCQMTVQRLELMGPHIERLALDDGRESLLHAAFDAYVNRPLVGNAPVRKPFFLAPAESILALKKITSEIDWAVCELLLKGSCLSRIQRMLERVQRSDVNVLARSLILLNMYFDEKLLGQFTMKTLISDHVRQLTHVPDNLWENEHVSTFLGRLAKPIYDTMKLKTLNRSRQRVYIEGIMLAEWQSLQEEARLVDAKYRRDQDLDDSTPPYFSQYVLTHMIRIMDRHLAVGIELEIFHGPFDLSIAFWYRDFLLSALLNTLSMMHHEKAKAPPPAKQGKGNKKKSNKNKKSNAQQRQFLMACKEDEFELLLLGLKRDICRGIKKFIAALRQAKMLEQKGFEFTTPQRVFDERFEVFTSIRQPSPMRYQDFVQGSDFSAFPQNDLLQSVASSFLTSKQTTEILLQNFTELTDQVYAAIHDQDLRSLVKVCIGNAVYLQKLRSLVQSDDSKAKVSFEFEGNSEFCTIKLL
jgi:hypothetical protein